MAPRRGALSKIWVGKWDFSGETQKVEIDLSVARQEWQTLQSAALESVAIAPGGEITQNGYFFDTAANSLEQELAAAIAAGSTLYVAALFGTDTPACPAYVAAASNAGGMQIGSPVDGLITLNGSWHQGTGIGRGLRAFDGNIAATGAQTYIDFGAAGAAGGKAWLFVRSITGTATNATFTVQSDDNTGFGSPTTKCTFTVSAAGAYEQAMTGAVDRYARLNCTSMGGATGFALGLIVAVNGITN